MIEYLGWAIIGALGAAALAWIPALHIYNVAGYLLLASGVLAPWLSPERMAFLFLGMVTAYAMLNTLPAVFLSVPDESTLFLVLPAQKYLMQRRGHEAVILSGIGGLAGVVVLALLLPFVGQPLAMLREILRPHLGWLLWTIIAYMLLSEWPKGSDHAPAGWRRWASGWGSLSAGLATFVLTGLLGIILLYRPLVPVEVAYQNLMPAFVGLFAVPWVIQNLLARGVLPPQHLAHSVDAPPAVVAQGIMAGVLGGLFAAFFPIVTGGIGGLLAGHATAQRDERAFIISQGTAKVVYYAGGFLFFFIPGLHLTRGGMAWMLSTRYTPYDPALSYWAAAAVLICGVLAFFLLLGLGRLMALAAARVPYRLVSWGTLGLLVALVVGMTGLMGLAICAVATGLGLIPVLWGSRRSHAMGVLLLPIALAMVGAGEAVVRLLGLL